MQAPTGDMVFSGMQFRDFGTDNCFRIEDSRLYKVSLQHLGYKTVEFVAYYANGNAGGAKLLFVEAKTSVRVEAKVGKFTDEVADISQKFMDALQLICGAWHGGRKDKVPLPTNFANFRESGKKISFILVVKNSGDRDLLTMRDAISTHLVKERRLWKFDIKVLNEELAIKENLVLAGIDPEPIQLPL